MESSIAVFLWRQPACERLPTSTRGKKNSECVARRQRAKTTNQLDTLKNAPVGTEMRPAQLRHTKKACVAATAQLVP